MSEYELPESFYKQFTWSHREMTLQRFIEKHKKRLPVLVLTTTGHSGFDGSMHEVGSEELYWIFGIQKQRRIVVKDANEQYLSFPMDYPLLFQRVRRKDEAPSSPMTLTEIAEERLEGQRIILENNQKVSFNSGADGGSSTSFGVLEIIDNYDEKYLLAYSLLNGEIHSVTVGIPVYMPITLKVACGFENADDATYIDWIGRTNSIVDTFPRLEVKPCKELLLFPEPPSGEYEYINAHVYVKIPHSDADAGYSRIADENNDEELLTKDDVTTHDNDVILQDKQNDDVTMRGHAEKYSKGPRSVRSALRYSTLVPLDPVTLPALPVPPVVQTPENDYDIYNDDNDDDDDDDGFIDAGDYEEIVDTPLPPPPLPSYLHSIEVSVMTTRAPPRGDPPPPVPTKTYERSDTLPSSHAPPCPPLVSPPDRPPPPLKQYVPRELPKRSSKHDRKKTSTIGGHAQRPPPPPPPGREEHNYRRAESNPALSEPVRRPPTQRVVGLVNPSLSSSTSPDPESSASSTKSSPPLPAKQLPEEPPAVIGRVAPVTPPKPAQQGQTPAASKGTSHRPHPTPPVPRSDSGDSVFLSPGLAPSSSTSSTASFGWKDAADIPPDADVSEFNVEEVLRCLELLNLSSSLVDSFRDATVDGMLLMALDEDILVNDFGCRGFEAKKVMMFCKHGWRPKRR